MTDITPADKDGKYEFTISYSERELLCEVEKQQDILHVIIDKTLHSDLKINKDGSVEQTEGTPIPASTIEYIKNGLSAKHFQTDAWLYTAKHQLKTSSNTS